MQFLLSFFQRTVFANFSWLNKYVFPYHDEVKYTLKGALRDAEIDIEEFLKYLLHEVFHESG